jgi:hypothetical protein
MLHNNHLPDHGTRLANEDIQADPGSESSWRSFPPDILGEAPWLP